MTSSSASFATRRGTVVFFHSSGGSGRQWQSLADRLSVDRAVHAIDLHGHGRCPEWHDDSPFRLADDAALAAPFLHGEGPIDLVGHSFGGAVAFKVASLYPDRIRSVVAYEPVLFRLLFDDASSADVAADVRAVSGAMDEALRRQAPEEAAARFIDFWSGTGAWQSLPAGPRQSIAARMPSVLRHFDALAAEPFDRAPLSRFGDSVLLLTGGGTVAATRRIGERLRTELAAARHETLARMGHMGPVTHASVVDDRIVAFLQARPEADVETRAGELALRMAA